MHMKQKEKQELRAMKSPELVKKANDIKGEIAKAMRERTTKPQKNVRAIGAMRRRLAVVLTIERELRNV